MTRSYSQTNRFEKTIPNAVKVLRRQGPKAFNDMSAGYIQRDYSGLRSNQLWNADHHRFDVMVRHDGRHVRPWLTAFQDVRSRKIVGWHISAVSANSDTIMLALRAGIVGHGIPEEFLFDNGKDFHCSAIQGRTKRQLQQSEDVEQTVTSVCAGLEIKVTHCWPYHGQSKPIERFFGTCESRFGKLQSTYCGNSTANKPENLAAKLDRGAAPTLAEFIEAFGAWLEGDYHCAPHTGDAMDGRTPAQVFDECLEVKRVADSSALEVMLWKPSQQKVGRIGVRCGGLYYGKDELRLIDWAGKEVVVRSDPADVSRVAVCRPDGSLICIAPSNDKLPFRSTAEEAREAIADLKKNARAVKNYHRARPRLHQDPAGRMYEQRAAKAKAEREAAPPPAPKLTTIATPMDDQLPLLERAMRANAANTPPSEQRPRFSIYDNPPETELKLPSFLEIGKSIAEKMRRQHEEEDRAAEDRATDDAFFSLGEKLRKEAASG
jgi:transposase InsO family protein